MKRLTVTAWLLLMALPVLSEARHETAVLFSAGPTLQSRPGQFADWWKPGYNIGTGSEHRVAPNLILSTGIEYNSFTFDRNGPLPTGTRRSRDRWNRSM